MRLPPTRRTRHGYSRCETPQAPSSTEPRIDNRIHPRHGCDPADRGAKGESQGRKKRHGRKGRCLPYGANRTHMMHRAFESQFAVTTDHYGSLWLLEPTLIHSTSAGSIAELRNPCAVPLEKRKLSPAPSRYSWPPMLI